MIGMCGVGGCGEGCAAWRGRVGILQHLAALMDGDCGGVGV